MIRCVCRLCSGSDGKTSLYILRKSHIHSAKEPYIFHKTTPYFFAREPYGPVSRIRVRLRAMVSRWKPKSGVCAAKVPYTLRKRAPYIWQKSPIFSAKEHYIPAIRRVCRLWYGGDGKRALWSTKEPYTFRKRAPYIPQKSPSVPRQSPTYLLSQLYAFAGYVMAVMGKILVIFRKRALYTPKRAVYLLQKSPIHSAKEPHTFRKRAQYLLQKRPATLQKSPIHSAKESYIFCKRALRLCQRGMCVPACRRRCFDQFVGFVFGVVGFDFVTADRTWVRGL